MLRVKAADLPGLARFLSSVAGRDVVDRTGIQGKYEFDLDWSRELQEPGGSQANGFGAAAGGVKALGLKLEAGKESRKILVVDRANKAPTPN